MVRKCDVNKVTIYKKPLTCSKCGGLIFDDECCINNCKTIHVDCWEKMYIDLPELNIPDEELDKYFYKIG